MARPLRIEFKGAFYHVTARGNERVPTTTLLYHSFLKYFGPLSLKYHDLPLH